MHNRWKLGASALAAAALTVALAVETTPAIASASAATAARPAALAKTFNVKLAQEFIRSELLRHVGTTVRVSGTIKKLDSTNWSGYAATGARDTFTAVSGSWVEPTGKCTSTTSLAAFWVGIDGISSSDPTVEQDGTIIECISGSAMYADWWEMYPTNSVQIVHTVSPGDRISGKVTYAGGKYKLSVTDSSHSADSFSVSKACGTTACERMSAEWIAEAPCCVSSGNVYPLVNFGTWKSTSSKNTYKGKSGTVTGSGAATVDEITMVDSSKAVKAQPSALSSGGATFSVKWKKAS